MMHRTALSLVGSQSTDLSVQLAGSSCGVIARKQFAKCALPHRKICARLQEVCKKCSLNNVVTSLLPNEKQLTSSCPATSVSH